MTEHAAASGPPQCKWDLYADGHRCPRAPDPRHGSRGPRLRDYCYQADGPGQPVHDPRNAWRIGQRLQAAAAEAQAAGPGPSPVTMTQARVTGAELLQSLHAEVARIEDILASLRAAVAAATNPATAEAEIKAVRDEARRDIEAAAQQAEAAGQRADAAKHLAETADAAAEQIDEDLAAAEQRAAEAVRAATALLWASALAWRTAYRQASRARAEADQAIGQARTEMELVIEQARSAAAELVRTAQDEQAQAVRDAASAREAARLAQQEAAGAKEAAAQVRQELDRYRADTQQMVTLLRADAERERRELRADLEGRAQRAEDAAGHLRDELARLRPAAGQSASGGRRPRQSTATTRRDRA